MSDAFRTKLTEALGMTWPGSDIDGRTCPSDADIIAACLRLKAKCDGLLLHPEGVQRVLSRLQPEIGGDASPDYCKGWYAGVRETKRDAESAIGLYVSQITSGDRCNAKQDHAAGRELLGHPVAPENPRP